MFVDPIEHHGVPYKTVLFFEYPVVFVREGEEAGWDTAFLEDVEGGETFAVGRMEVLAGIVSLCDE